MTCPNCHAETQPGAQFCLQCGSALPPPQVPAAAGGFAPPSFEPPRPPDPLPNYAPPAGPLNIVEQTTPIAQANQWTDQSQAAYPPTQQQAAYPSTQQQPVQYPTQQQPAYVQQQQYPQQYGQQASGPAPYAPPPLSKVPKGASAVAALAGLAGIAAIAAAFLPMETIKSDAAIPQIIGDYKLNDLIATNLLIAVVIAGVCLLGGGVLDKLGYRIGAGLAGGAALALAPFAVIVWGINDTVSKTAQSYAEASAAGGSGGTFFEGKPGIGFWVLVVAAVLGVVALLIGVSQSGPDGSPKLNVGLCVGGAVAALVAGIGQLVPQHGASLSDNFSTGHGQPAAFVYGRVGIIAVVALAGAAGFLRNNRWGVGLALGSVSIYAWMWVSSIAEAGDRPAPPAFGNPGALDAKPYILTTVGVVAMILLAAMALFAGASQSKAAPAAAQPVAAPPFYQ